MCVCVWMCWTELYVDDNRLLQLVERQGEGCGYFNMVTKQVVLEHQTAPSSVEITEGLTI